MCLDGSPKVDNSAAEQAARDAEQARLEEERRQQRVRLGLADIDAIFDGGEYSTGYSYDPDAAAYSPTGTAVSGGFQPFLDDRHRAMVDYYNPQLEMQAARARKELAFSLARAGQTESTTAGERQGEINRDYQLGAADIVNRADTDRDRVRGQLLDAKLGAEQTLRATGDTTAGVNQALGSLRNYAQATPTMSPLGDMFAGLATGYRVGQDAQRVGRMDEMLRDYRSRTPVAGGGAGRVVRPL